MSPPHQKSGCAGPIPEAQRLTGVARPSAEADLPSAAILKVRSTGYSELKGPPQVGHRSDVTIPYAALHRGQQTFADTGGKLGFGTI